MSVSLDILQKRFWQYAADFSKNHEAYQKAKGAYESNDRDNTLQANARAADFLQNMIHSHQKLSSAISDIRQNKNELSNDTYESYEDEFVSSSQALLLLRGRKDPQTLSFRKRYIQIWKKHQALFLLVLKLFVMSLIVGFSIGYSKSEYATLFVPQELMERIIHHQDWFDGLRNNPLLGGLGIAWHNIQVCLLIFFLSALLGLGGIALLVFNGISIGFIMGYCTKYGFDTELINFITAHGFLELTLIIMSSFAGLIMGKEFFRFGTKKNPLSKTLSQRLGKASQEGFHVFLVCAAWLCLAGAFEGFVSPFNSIPYLFKLIAGLTIVISFWLYTLLPSTHKNA